MRGIYVLCDAMYNGFNNGMIIDSKHVLCFDNQMLAANRFVIITKPDFQIKFKIDLSEGAYRLADAQGMELSRSFTIAPLIQLAVKSNRGKRRKFDK